jgi:hypothetical protein
VSSTGKAPAQGFSRRSASAQASLWNTVRHKPHRHQQRENKPRYRHEECPKAGQDERRDDRQVSLPRPTLSATGARPTSEGTPAHGATGGRAAPENDDACTVCRVCAGMPRQERALFLCRTPSRRGVRKGQPLNFSQFVNDDGALRIEVETWTHFSTHLVHAANGEALRPAFLPYLYASLVAQACNFGLDQMAQSTDLVYERLAWCITVLQIAPCLPESAYEVDKTFNACYMQPYGCIYYSRFR